MKRKPAPAPPVATRGTAHPAALAEEQHVFEQMPGSPKGACRSCDLPLHDRIHTGTKRGPASYMPAAGSAILQMTQAEVCTYVAFVLEGAANLAGGFGALTPRHCIHLAERLKEVAGYVQAAEEELEAG